jgi:DOPA 4,5-dioxygenase
MDTNYPINNFQHYHAHLYFDQKSLNVAQQILENLQKETEFKIGRIHQKSVGPHPKWSCQVKFNHQEFELIIPWLDEHRAGLSVLVHPVTGDDLHDHTQLAAWLGDAHMLKLEMFSCKKDS